MALDMKSTGLSGGNFGDELDDYEEGTWTITHTDFQFSAELGYYTKVGNLVNIGGYVKVGTGGTSGNAFIGLPFTSGNYAGTGGGNCIWDDMSTYQSRTQAFPRIVDSNTEFYIYCNSPGTGWSTILIPSTNNYMIWNFNYMT